MEELHNVNMTIDGKLSINEIDWRTRDVILLSEEIRHLDYGLIPKNTPITEPNATNHNSQRLNFNNPSGPALFLSLSQKAYEQAIKIHPYKNSSVHFSTKDSSTPVFDYLEQIMSSIVFACSALESFANEAIPEDYLYESKKQKGKIIKVYSKASIEKEKISLNEKLGVILPDALGLETAKGKEVWENYKKLEGLRNRIIHLKSIDISHSTKDNRFPESIWKELLDPNQFNYPLIAKKMIMYFLNNVNLPHWIKYCPIRNSVE